MDKEFLHLIENADHLLPPDSRKLDDETLICECFCVNVRDIRDICTTKVDLDLLKDRYQLGMGCQSCLKNKDTWIDNIF